MNNPNRKDLPKLKSLLNQVEKLELQYDSLTEETKTFLQDEFHGQTKIHLYNFDRNITDTIKEFQTLKNILE
jgi:hypothetical protein